MRRLYLIRLAAILVLAATAQAAPTLREKVDSTTWAKIRGANFIPSYASNTYDIWRNYDHAIFDRELRLVSAVGYNSVRLWLNYQAYDEIGSKMADRVEDAVRLCAKHRLRAAIVLFDSCGIRPRKDVRWMAAGDAFDTFQKSPRFTSIQKKMMENLFGKYVRGFGAHTLVPVSPEMPMMALLWQNWQSTPGNDRLGPAWYSKLESYVSAIVGRLKDNPAILLWDLMNEPEFASEGPVSPTELITPEMKKLGGEFLSHFHGYCKRRYPNEVVSVGWAHLDNSARHAGLADVLTYHVYGNAAQLQSSLEKAGGISRSAGKQILITETLANWDFGSPDFGRMSTDEAQLAHYQEVLPVLVKSPIGWIGWGMVMSRDFNPYTDIFYPDGHPRPAAVHLRRALTEALQ